MGACSSSTDQDESKARPEKKTGGTGGGSRAAASVLNTRTESSMIKPEYKLTSEQLQLIEKFYNTFDTNQDGLLTEKSLANMVTSPREEISALFGFVGDDMGSMSKESMVEKFQQAKAAICESATSTKSSDFVTEMLKVLLAVTKGTMTEEEGNAHLEKRAKDMGLDPAVSRTNSARFSRESAGM